MKDWEFVPSLDMANVEAIMYPLEYFAFAHRFIEV